MTTQKTWTDLLGRFNQKAKVHGKYISLQASDSEWMVIWSFESNQQAEECFSYWVNGQ